MPIPATLVETSPGVWVADTDPAAVADGFVVSPSAGAYAIDDTVSSGLGLFLDDDSITLYIDTAVTVPASASSGSTFGSGHRRRRRRLFLDVIFDRQGRIIGYVSNSPVT